MAGTISALQADIDEFARKTKNLMENQIPFAVSVALNETAKKTNARLKSQMGQHIDRPTPWTKNSTTVTKWSTKKDLKAKLGYKSTVNSKGTPASNYLQPVVFGGPKPRTPFDAWLQSRGFMPRGMFAVPGSKMPLNRYGNVAPGVFKGVRTALSKEAKFTKTGRLRKTRAAKYFVMKRKGRPFAIGINTGTSNSRIAFFFVDSTSYKKSFEFYRLTRTDSTGFFPAELRKAYRAAVRTAR